MVPQLHRPAPSWRRASASCAHAARTRRRSTSRPRVTHAPRASQPQPRAQPAQRPAAWRRPATTCQARRRRRLAQSTRTATPTARLATAQLARMVRKQLAGAGLGDPVVPSASARSDVACPACVAGWRTKDIGTKGLSDCLAPPGYELIPGFAAISECSIGFFKSDWNRRPCEPVSRQQWAGTHAAIAAAAGAAQRLALAAQARRLTRAALSPTLCSAAVRHWHHHRGHGRNLARRLQRRRWLGHHRAGPAVRGNVRARHLR